MWRAILLVITSCLVVHGEPLPEIKTGTSDREVEIYMTPWYSGFVSTSGAFLTGTVMETSSKVQTSPRQTWLSESCVIRVERAFGRMEHVEGITTAKLMAGYENSPYEPVDPNWGRLRHLQKGRRILVLLHEYEGAPSFGFEALIELAPGLEDLPSILRRTGFDPVCFTESDFAVLKVASPLFYKQTIVEAGTVQETRRDDATMLNRLVFGCVSGFLLLLLAADFIRRPFQGTAALRRLR